jgi:hypothetical protein
MSAIDQLRTRVDQLLRQYAAAQLDLKNLRNELKDKDHTIASLQLQLTKTEEQLLAQQIGRAIPDAESRANSRKKLDQVIREIDKILTTLND